MRHKAHVLIAVILVLVYAAAVTAQSTEIEQLRLEAEQGNVNAQCNLGEMYYDGDGVPQDYQEALKWFSLAAEQGHASAQRDLGEMYYNGEGVAQDYQEAVKWLPSRGGTGSTPAAQARSREDVLQRRRCCPGLPGGSKVATVSQQNRERSEPKPNLGLCITTA